MLLIRCTKPINIEQKSNTFHTFRTNKTEKKSNLYKQECISRTSCNWSKNLNYKRNSSMHYCNKLQTRQWYRTGFYFRRFPFEYRAFERNRVWPIGESCSLASPKRICNFIVCLFCESAVWIEVHSSTFLTVCIEAVNRPIKMIPINCRKLRGGFWIGFWFLCT